MKLPAITQITLTASIYGFLKNFNLAKAVQISKEMGFKGAYSLETAGPQPYSSVQSLLDRLLENL
jgi:hypothetical protein